MKVIRPWLCLVHALDLCSPAARANLGSSDDARAGAIGQAEPKANDQAVHERDSENSKKRQTSSPQSKSNGANRKPFNIPQSQMTASATSQHSGYEASRSVDGNSNTMWHTLLIFCLAPTVSLPQSITLNLGGTYNVNALHYLPRQDGYLNGAFSYRVCEHDGRFTLITAGNWANDHSEKTAAFAPTKASYIRLEAVAGHGGAHRPCHAECSTYRLDNEDFDISKSNVSLFAHCRISSGYSASITGADSGGSGNARRQRQRNRPSRNRNEHSSFRSRTSSESSTDGKRLQCSRLPIRLSFAGTWRGTINCSSEWIVGHIIVIDGAQKILTVSKTGSGAGGATGNAPTSMGADGLTAKLPGLNGTWALKPNPDGKTARVRLTGSHAEQFRDFHRE